MNHQFKSEKEWWFLYIYFSGRCVYTSKEGCPLCQVCAGAPVGVRTPPAQAKKVALSEIYPAVSQAFHIWTSALALAHASFQCNPTRFLLLYLRTTYFHSYALRAWKGKRKKEKFFSFPWLYPIRVKDCKETIILMLMTLSNVINCYQTRARGTGLFILFLYRLWKSGRRKPDRVHVVPKLIFDYISHARVWRGHGSSTVWNRVWFFDFFDICLVRLDPTPRSPSRTNSL